jgi:hypothetical protein
MQWLKLTFMLDNEDIFQPEWRYEQASAGNTRSNPFHALRGVVHAFDLSNHGRFDQHSFQTAD